MALAETNQLTDAEYEHLITDDEAYFEHCLQIRTKSDGLKPLVLNSSQLYAHAEIERMLEEVGFVRVIIVKGRQQGISTYIGGRFYKRVSTSMGVLAFIVTHEDAATQNLFSMTKRYHDNNLDDLRPETGIANANELKFSELDSGYKIATAGARSAGRSNTIQYLHASEFDFWPDKSADEVWKGLYEAVPSGGEGTEVVIESTADKPGGRLHRMVKAAIKGESAFRLIFIPWFVHDEYTTPAPDDWEPPQAFLDYQVVHDITDDQLYWAWHKNRDMAGFLGVSADEFCISFKREYPATIDEAFENAGDDLSRVFPLPWIRAAQARWVANQDKELAPMTGLGADVAQGGPDKTCVSPLHGVRFEKLHTLPGAMTTDGPAVAGMVLAHRRDDAVVAIDLTGGWGGSAVTHIRDHLQIPALGINFGSGATKAAKDSKLPLKNMRAQLHWLVREGLDPVKGDSIELPPDPELEEEMLACTFTVTPGGIQICNKDEVKKIIGRSPDKLDALILAWHAGGLHANRSALSRRRARPATPVHTGEGKVVGRR